VGISAKGLRILLAAMHVDAVGNRFWSMSTVMSEQAIEFLEEWINEKVQRTPPTPAPLERQAEILVLKCQADAAKAGVPLDEIVEEVGDLEDLITAKLEEAEQPQASPPPAGSEHSQGGGGSS
jgi:hypothetical protein